MIDKQQLQRICKWICDPKMSVHHGYQPFKIYMDGLIQSRMSNNKIRYELENFSYDTLYHFNRYSKAAKIPIVGWDDEYPEVFQQEYISIIWETFERYKNTERKVN